jgi:hypothetical protein
LGVVGVCLCVCVKEKKGCCKPPYNCVSAKRANWEGRPAGGEGAFLREERRPAARSASAPPKAAVWRKRGGGGECVQPTKKTDEGSDYNIGTGKSGGGKQNQTDSFFESTIGEGERRMSNGLVKGGR